MSLLRAMMEKPWLTPGLHGAAAIERDEPSAASAAGTGLGVFLCVVGMLFALLTLAYLMRMGGHGPAGHGASDWASMSKPPLLWINTFMLMGSSLGWLMARRAARRGDMPALRLSLSVGGLLALAFIIGQISVWRQLNAPGYSLAARWAYCGAVDNPLAQTSLPLPTGNPALAFFYLITALHGLHLIGGLGVWGRTMARMAGGADIAALEGSVGLTARYWHFLLLIWLLMFGLLLMT